MFKFCYSNENKLLLFINHSSGLFSLKVSCLHLIPLTCHEFKSGYFNCVSFNLCLEYMCVCVCRCKDGSDTTRRNTAPRNTRAKSFV